MSGAGDWLSQQYLNDYYRTKMNLGEYYESLDKREDLRYNDCPVAMPNLGCEDPGDTFSVRNQQVGGNHYQGKPYQPWDIIDTWELNYYEGNVLKYLLRWRYKNGLEDLKKAKHYLEYLIEKEERNAVTAPRD